MLISLTPPCQLIVETHTHTRTHTHTHTRTHTHTYTHAHTHTHTFSFTLSHSQNGETYSVYKFSEFRSLLSLPLKMTIHLTFEKFTPCPSAQPHHAWHTTGSVLDVEILRIQKTTRSTLQNDYRADFWEIIMSIRLTPPCLLVILILKKIPVGRISAPSLNGV